MVFCFYFLTFFYQSSVQIVIEEDDLDRQLQAALEKARRKNVEKAQQIAPEERVLKQVAASAIKVFFGFLSRS